MPKEHMQWPDAKATPQTSATENDAAYQTRPALRAIAATLVVLENRDRIVYCFKLFDPKKK
jgi:hypothetical protein